jgi:hypothetical protein
MKVNGFNLKARNTRKVQVAWVQGYIVIFNVTGQQIGIGLEYCEELQSTTQQKFA